MGPVEFRRLALELPEASEASHMGHPDFRVGGKIFATLGYPSPGWGMVKLPPDQQDLFIHLRPDAFVPAKGAWGRGGATQVNLRIAPRAMVRRALLAAWRNTAPKALAGQIEDGASSVPRKKTSGAGKKRGTKERSGHDGHRATQPAARSRSRRTRTSD